jgi:hypothetical protein
MNWTTVKARNTGTVAPCKSSGCFLSHGRMNQSVPPRVSPSKMTTGITICKTECRSSMCNPYTIMPDLASSLVRLGSMSFNAVELPQLPGWLKKYHASPFGYRSPSCHSSQSFQSYLSSFLGGYRSLSRCSCMRWRRSGLYKKLLNCEV